MPDYLHGDASNSIYKFFTVDQTKPAVKIDWGYYFDGEVGGHYAEMFIWIYDQDDNLIGNGYKLHDSGAAGIFAETDLVYRGTPKINSGNNHSDYGGTPFEAGMVIKVNFRAATEIWNPYEFGVGYATVEMSD